LVLDVMHAFLEFIVLVHVHGRTTESDRGTVLGHGEVGGALEGFLHLGIYLEWGLATVWRYGECVVCDSSL
jgi:hypothetical protein